MLKRYALIVLIVFLLIISTVSTTLAAVFLIQANNRQAQIDALQAQVNRLNNQVNNVYPPIPSTTTTVTPTASGTPTVSPSLTPTSSSTCNNVSASGNIIVTSPCPNDLLGPTLQVLGSANVVENSLAVDILDAAGHVIHHQVLTANAPDQGQFGSFASTFAWTVPSAHGNGTIKFYSDSPKDGSQINIVQFAVRY